jgi:hypothetical protein
MRIPSLESAKILVARWRWFRHADTRMEVRVTNTFAEYRRRRGSKKVLAIVFTTIGVGCGLVAGISAAVTAESISGDVRAEGTVVALSDDGKGHAPVVEFTPPGRPLVRFTGSLGSEPPAFHVGERVAVRYDPNDPQDAGIDMYWQTWFVPTLFAILAAPFLLAGVVFGVLVLRARRRLRAVAGSLPIR